MLCKVCNTRVGPGSRTCPNCGSHSISASPSVESDSPKKLPNLHPLDESKPRTKESAARAEPEASVEVDMELEAVEVELNEPAEVGSPGAAAEAAAASEEKDDPPQARAAGPLVASDAFGAPDPGGLRAMLAECPQLLEPGLSVYKNERGTPLGVGYTSAVGEIDLLARDADGGLVVVMVADRCEGEALVAAVLQRVGWVRKHLSGGGQTVRAIVLLDRVRGEISYAAAAVSDTVSFKTYQVALTFEDVQF